MRITRPAFNFLVDKRTVEVYQSGIGDPRTLTMIPAFKTSADNLRGEEEKNEKK